MKTELQNRNEVELEQIARVVSGFAFKSELFNDQKIGIPLVRIRDLEKGESNTYYSGEYEKDYIVEKGDLLISMDGEFKIFQWKSKSAVLNQRVCKLIIDKKLAIPKYIFYVISKKLKEIEDKTPFVTVKHISSKRILSIKLLLPLLSIQQKIVSILEKAEKLKQLRDESDKLTNDLLKAVFLEMFGDPVNNIRKWNIKKIEDISLKTQIGPFGTQLHEEDYVNDGIPLINPKHIRGGQIVPDKSKTITKKKYSSLSNYHLRENDVIIGRRGDMGNCAVITKKEDGWLCGTGSLFIRPDNLLNSIYLEYILSSSSYKKKLENESKGITMMNLNMTIINNLEIPLPPISLQKKFASTVEKVKQLSEYQKQSKEHTENLFNNLMQKAFRGELAC